MLTKAQDPFSGQLFQVASDPDGCGSKPMGSHFGVGAPPILLYFSGLGPVWGYGLWILTHAQISPRDLRDEFRLLLEDLLERQCGHRNVSDELFEICREAYFCARHKGVRDDIFEGVFFLGVGVPRKETPHSRMADL